MLTLLACSFKHDTLGALILQETWFLFWDRGWTSDGGLAYLFIYLLFKMESIEKPSSFGFSFSVLV